MSIFIGLKICVIHEWSFDEDKWELYNVEEDFSECHNLAEKNPKKLHQLIEMWWAEADKYNVLPLDDRKQERLISREILKKEKTSYTYYPGTVRVPAASASHVKNRSHSITAIVDISSQVPEGPICAIGGVGSGWSLYIKDEHLVYCYNNNGNHYYIRPTKKIPIRGGQLRLRFEFEMTGKEEFGAGGIGRLYIDNEKTGEGEIPHTVRFIYAVDETFDIGRDTGSPVTDEYKAGAVFTGVIKKVVVDLAGERHNDPETETKIIMKRQ